MPDREKAKKCAEKFINTNFFKDSLCNIYIEGYVQGIEDRENSWISTKKQKPICGNTVQVLICNECGDSPSISVDAGKYFSNDIWIVDNDIPFGVVIGWKELEKAPNMECIKELRNKFYGYSE